MRHIVRRLIFFCSILCILFLSHATIFGSCPTFVGKPQVSFRDDGKVMVMEFRAKSTLKPTFVWHKGGEIVAQTDRVNIIVREEANQIYYAALEIKERTEKDAGQFICTAKTDSGRLTATFNMKSEAPSSPVFVEKPQITSRDGGNLMVMEFRAKSILKPTFIWHKGDEIVAQSDRMNIVLREEANQIYYAALEIREPTREKDAGQFICLAINDSGKLTATFTVKFEVPQGAPVFTRKPRMYQVTYGSGDVAVSFDVGFQAGRNPKVMWINPKGEEMKKSTRIRFFTYLDGPNNTFTAKLEFKNQKAKDSGTYICHITNEVGEANVECTLNVIGTPLDGDDDESEA